MSSFQNQPHSVPPSSKWVLSFISVITLMALISVGILVSKSLQGSPFGQSATPSVAGVKSGGDSLYPNPQLTPGASFPNITKDDICKSGYSSSVRDVSTSLKKKVFEDYGISYPQPTGAYETDHFVSLELGGSNDITNLWPEPAEPRPGFHEKDKVENYLHKEVCDGHLALVEAQEMEKNDWYAVYQKIS